MPKIRTSFALSKEILELLKLISEKENRSMANTLEVIIKENAERKNIITKSTDTFK